MASKNKIISYKPAKPTLAYDGECGFCYYWVVRWKTLTEDSVAYVPYQEIKGEAKEIPVAEFRKAVKLIDIDGKIFSGAEAAYRTLAYNPERGYWYRLYLNSFLFRLISKIGYSYVANNRPFLFRLTKLVWGKNPEKPQHFRGYLFTFLFGIISGLFIAARFRRKRKS